jgi:glycosyltransferase involved in cell wall biosynthesis
MFISVIVSTYNRPDALAAVMRGLAHQTAGHFETIVADDGSKPDMSMRPIAAGVMRIPIS